MPSPAPFIIRVALDATRLLCPLSNGTQASVDDGYHAPRPLVLSTAGDSYQFGLEGPNPQLVLIECPELFALPAQDTTYSSTFDVYYRQECIYSGNDNAIRLTQRSCGPPVFESHIASHYWPHLMDHYLNGLSIKTLRTNFC